MHIIAIDNSGSTSNKKAYWDMVISIVDKAPENTQYILWNSQKINDFTTKKYIIKRAKTEAKGRTDPLTFIDFITREQNLSVSGSSLDLTIITDGQIRTEGYKSDNHSIEKQLKLKREEDVKTCVYKCHKKLNASNINFPTLTIYFISTDSENQSMDLSVSAPFINKATTYQTQVYEMLTGKVLENAVEEKFQEFGMSPLDASNKELYNNIADGLRDTLVLNEEKSTKKQTRLDLNKYLNNPQLFIDEAEEILKKIHLENAGGQPEEEKLKNLGKLLEDLKVNLHQKITIDNKKIMSPEDSERIRAQLKNHDKSAAKKSMQDIIARLSAFASNATKLRLLMNSHIDTMLARVKQGFDFNFTPAENNRLKKATENNQQVALKATADEEDPALNYECSITYTKDIPTLLIRKGFPAIFTALDKGRDLDKFIANPLLLLENYSELSKPINKSISGQLGLITFFENRNQTTHQPATIKQTGTRRTLSNFRFIPGEFEGKDMTKGKVSSFIVLDNDPSYIPITNFALSEIFFGNKKLVGLPALWLAVLYFYLKESGRFEPNETAIDNESNAAFMEAFKATLIGRLKSDSSLITLSGPEENIEPNLTCPLDIALWYCVISPELYEHGINNRLRGVVTKYHLKLLDLLGYPYPKEWTIRQLLRYQIFAVMMREEKVNSSNLRNWLRCLYQNSIRLEDEDGSIILLDGNSALNPELFRVRVEKINPNTTKEKEAYLRELPIAKSVRENNQRHTQKSTLKLIEATALDKTSAEYRDSLPIKELFALEKLLDKNKTLGDITIPNNLIVEPIPEPKTNYNYSDNQKFDCEDALYKEFIRNKAYLNTSRSKLIEYIKDPKTRDKIIKLKQNETMKDEFIKDLMKDSIRKKFIKRIATRKIIDKFTEHSQQTQITRDKFIKLMETQITRDKFINYLMGDATINYRHIEYIHKQKIKNEFIKDLRENPIISDKFVKYLQEVPHTKRKLMTYLENPDTVDEFTKSIPNPRASRNELISYEPDSTTRNEFIKYMVDRQKNKAKNPKDTLPKNIENIVEKVISDYSAEIKTSPSLTKATKMRKNSFEKQGFFRSDEGNASGTSHVVSEHSPSCNS